MAAVMAEIAGAETKAVAEPAAVAFPSVAWFRRLADLMNANRARQEQLGYCDCVAEFVVLDGGPARSPVAFQVTFEEFEATDVRQSTPADRERADYSLEATLATWRSMIESIAEGSGRPALEYTLNRMSHAGTPVFLRSDDPLRKDMYFRFNQSLQEFVNASALFRTAFSD